MSPILLDDGTHFNMQSFAAQVLGMGRLARAPRPAVIDCSLEPIQQDIGVIERAAKQRRAAIVLYQRLQDMARDEQPATPSACLELVEALDAELRRGQ